MDIGLTELVSSVSVLGMVIQKSLKPGQHIPESVRKASVLGIILETHLLMKTFRQGNFDTLSAII